MSDVDLSAFKDRPTTAGVFMDFDGTLSEIVADAAAARPAEGVVDLLRDLANRLAVVAIVSGRSAHQLLDWLGPEVEIWGSHGAERTIDGRVEVDERGRPYLDVMRRVADEARRALDEDGVAVEDKGVMLGLHYRQAADTASAAMLVERVARDLASRHGLTVGKGRMVVELKPPVDFTKADVVRRRARELELKAAAFIGDDLVDLPAFDALDELAREAVATVRVGVDSPEAPDEVVARADVVVDGPNGVVEWLSLLLD
ncbi:MAG: trehalose-phosphatase [Actinomycetota bacterium]|nr:trehalose-phosphatase [Actinomycetota bacterium]